MDDGLKKGKIKEDSIDTILLEVVKFSVSEAEIKLPTSVIIKYVNMYPYIQLHGRVTHI